MTRRQERRDDDAKSDINGQRVAAAVKFIREHLHQSDVSLRAIGDHLLDNFFDGDPAAYASRKNGGGFRTLLGAAGSLDLPLSKTALSNAVRLAGIARQLGPTSAFCRLPQSIAIELLPLRELRAIEYLAIDIDASQMTVRQLREVVRDLRPKPATVRRREPRLVLAVAALERVLGDGESCLTIGPRELAEIDASDLARARATVDRLCDRLAELRASLGELTSSDVGTARDGATASPSTQGPIPERALTLAAGLGAAP